MSGKYGFYCAAALALGLIACKPSAKVTRTTPVANLKSYQVVEVRADGISRAYNLKNFLADSTVRALSKKCNFTHVVPAGHGGPKPDLLIDLNIRQMFRGGTGLIRNQNKATVDVLMVLTDGIDNDLLGSTWIRGESAQVMVSGSFSPEGQAVKAIADRVAAVLAKSGCTGQRIAREPEGGGTQVAANHGGGGGNTAGGGGAGGDDKGKTGNGDTGNGDKGNGDTGNGDKGNGDKGNGADDAKARATALNDEGKNLFRQANVEGALAKFKEAEALHGDPRFVYNQCLAYESLKKYDAATSTCKRVLTLNPDNRLTGKVQRRLEIIASLKKAG